MSEAAASNQQSRPKRLWKQSVRIRTPLQQCLQLRVEYADAGFLALAKLSLTPDRVADQFRIRAALKRRRTLLF